MEWRICGILLFCCFRTYISKQVARLRGTERKVVMISFDGKSIAKLSFMTMMNSEVCYG